MSKPTEVASDFPSEWTIERLVPGGDGFLRLPDGRAAFVPGALPGDRVEPLALDVRPDYVRSLGFRLLAAGPDRVEPACPVASRCGGCDWMHLEAGAQRRAKAALLREALERTGHFHELAPIEVVAPGPELAYRSRLRVHVDEAGKIGLFARRSQELVEIPRCIVCEPAVEAALPVLREAGARFPRALAAFSEIEIRTAPGGPRVALRLFPRRRARSAAVHELLGELRAHFAVSIEGQRVEHADQRYPLPGAVELAAPPSAFTQVNWAANLELVEHVVESASAKKLQTFCDLYCGAGNFTLPLAKAGLRGIGVDRVGAALAAGERAAREQGLELEFVAGPVPDVLRRLLEGTRRFDLVLLDPPRAGAREALAGVAELAPRSIAVCSCDPVTLARDLRELAARGYVLETVLGFDLFPQTHHVEAVAWMRNQ